MISEFSQPPRLPHPVRITEQSWPEGTVPVVSIHCITYQHGKFIREAIEGFLMQETTFPVEILIHDDASTDGTPDIIREYEAKHPQLIKPIYQTENQWSKGNKPGHINLARARGEFIAICEGDDYWTHPPKLQVQVETLHRHVDLSMCFHNAVEEHVESSQKQIFNTQFEGQRFYLEDMFNYAFVIPTASMLFRRHWLARPEWLSRCMCGDRAIQLLLADRGPFAFINSAWSVYRKHDGGITRVLSQNYARTVIPNWITMYYAFNKTTCGRHEALLRKEIRRLVKERSRFQIYALQAEFTAHKGSRVLPKPMESEQACRTVIGSLLENTASCLEEPDKKWFEQSAICTGTFAAALLSAGDAWYVRKNYSKAEGFYRAAARAGQCRARFYGVLLRCGLLGRVLRSLMHRASLYWSRMGIKSPR